ncbi:S41 family peptidase [Candidatus Kaiserbacteria bacterium]|nr:S41 family peptidase [Candidatus Kaiserbacteria bacterium]
MQSDAHFSTRLTFGLIAVFFVIGAAAGYEVGNRHSVSAAIGNASQPEGVDFSPVWKAWRIIDQKFVPAAVASSTPYVATSTADSDQKRIWGLISGLASSLDDPYTFFLPPDENQQFSETMSGQFEGVGMEIDIKDSVLTVVSPIKGTPAYKAGLKAGDLILKIDGESTEGMTVNNAVKKIRGPKGTQVKLFVLRQGWTAPKEIPVTRDVINVPTVTTEAKSGGVFVITLTTFTANSADLFRNALREFVQTGDSKLVLDLRGNPGGYLDAAVDMASWFLPSGTVVVTEDYAGHASNIVHRSSGYNIFNKNLKMVVLVDKGSASASEILAGALQTEHIAKLVGTNTFGKGSVQELVDITPDTALKLTVARWLKPDGVHIPLTGIEPDVEVPFTDDDLKAGKDPQMAKAIEILNGQ